VAEIDLEIGKGKELLVVSEYVVMLDLDKWC